MSLMKNLKRREVEIFGAKRVVRNETKKKEKVEPTPKKITKRKTKKALNILFSVKKDKEKSGGRII